MKKTSLILAAICLLSVGTTPLASAEVPVVDVYPANSANNPNSNQVMPAANQPAATLPQVISPDDLATQVKQLRQQIAGIAQLNLIPRLNKLQQEIRVLRGQLEVQGHKLQQLQKQSGSHAAIPVTISQQPASNPMPDAAPVNPTTKPQTSQTQSDQLILQEQQAYQNAYQLIGNRQYSRAILAMQELLKKYPNSVYSVNAHYWLGELYLIAGNTTVSRREFTTVIEKYPQSVKVADALLKIGFLDYDQGKWIEAKTYLNKVVKKFPESVAARLAKTRLQKIARAGH